MAVFETMFFSETLLRDVTVSVSLPMPSASRMEFGEMIRTLKKNEVYPVVWMLPTGTADYSKNIRSSRIEEYARKHHIAVVTPDVENSLGYNLPNGDAYFDYLTQELPMILHSIYPLSKKREETFIGGASNGGYTGYMIALRKPEQYGAAFSIGSGLDIEATKDIENSKFWYEQKMPAIYGKEREYYDPHIHDLTVMIDDLLKSGRSRPRFYAAYGTEDIYYSCGTRVVKHLQESDIDFTYREAPGKHDWEFWDTELNNVLDWLMM